MPTLVLMDFDGTITKNDTFIGILRFQYPLLKFLLGFFYLSPILVLFKLGFIPNWKAKQYVMRLAFSGMNKKDFLNLCIKFSLSDSIRIRPDALTKIAEHKENNDTIYIVTASPYYWVEAWSNQFKIPVIGTELEELDDNITGNILGKNCYGPEKVERIKAILDLSQYDKIITYGDSRGDKEMLDLADEKRFKPFR